VAADPTTPLVRLPLVVTNVETVAASVASVEASDARGPLTLTARNEGSGANEARAWWPDRAVEGRVTLSYRAPISGRVGDSLIQVGGLVSKNSPQPLTTIVPLDPIWVRFKVSESDMRAYQSRANAQSLPFQLILADNTVHPYPGHFANTVNQVDPKTGTLEVQVTFANPKQTILPGQFGRVRVRSSEKTNAILIPQKAVQDLQGMQSVLTVGPENKVLVRSVVTGDRVDENWVIEQGLKPGDRVIVEGLQKAQPGGVVTPKPYVPPATKPNPAGGV